MHYTKKEFRKFILDCRAMGVDIIPEFDTPGHSGAFTKVRPDLMLQATAKRKVPAIRRAIRFSENVMKDIVTGSIETLVLEHWSWE